MTFQPSQEEEGEEGAEEKKVAVQAPIAGPPKRPVTEIPPLGGKPYLVI